MRALGGLLIAISLSGCAAERVWAPDDAVRAARYSHPGPTEITLITSISDRSGEGAHSAVMINGSERILFDPAGNWNDARAPERHDVRFGMTPQMEANYLAYQAHGPFHVVTQSVTVSPEVAERAIQLAKENGPVPSAMCTSATSGLLRQLPGFEGVTSTLFPKSLMESMAERPGVKTRLIMGSPSKEDPDMVPRVSPMIRRIVGGEATQ